MLIKLVAILIISSTIKLTKAQEWKSYNITNATIYRFSDSSILEDGWEDNCNRFQINCFALYCDVNSILIDGNCQESDGKTEVLEDLRNIYFKFHSNNESLLPSWTAKMQEAVEMIDISNNSVEMNAIIGDEFQFLTTQGFHFIASGFWVKFELRKEVLPIIAKANQTGLEKSVIFSTKCGLEDIRSQFVELIKSYRDIWMWLTINSNIGFLVIVFTEFMRKIMNDEYKGDYLAFWIFLSVINILCNLNYLGYLFLFVPSIYIDIFLSGIPISLIVLM
jgi:hypothetical protein